MRINIEQLIKIVKLFNLLPGSFIHLQNIVSHDSFIDTQFGPIHNAIKVQGFF